jgi:hypothetical protein
VTNEREDTLSRRYSPIAAPLILAFGACLIGRTPCIAGPDDRVLCAGVKGDEPQTEVVTLTYFTSYVQATGGGTRSSPAEDSRLTAYLTELVTALNRMFVAPEAKSVGRDAGTSSTGSDEKKSVPGAEHKPADSVQRTVVDDLGFGRLLLHGTRCQNLQIKRALLRIDLPWPQVQLNLWAVQVSGSDDGEVSQQVRKIRKWIRDTHDEIVRIQDELKRLATSAPVRCDTWPERYKERFARGPLSLNEALIMLVLQPDGRHHVRELRGFVAEECANAHSNLCEPELRRKRARRGEKPEEPEHGRPSFERLEETIGQSLPFDRCDIFGRFFKAYGQVRDLRYEPVRADVETERRQEGMFNKVEQTRDLVDRLLRSLIDAYSADMEDLVFGPLLDRISNEERGSNRKEGTALVGRTRIAVNSGMEADLSPETASYAETTRPAPFGKNLLDLANPAKKTDAAGTEKIISGLPEVQAALLAAALLADTEPRYVKVAPGIAISVRPAVLPDEGAARLTIDARFGVNAGEIDPKDRKDLWVQPPPASVTSHHITTDTTVDVFDLFDISSFSIDVTTPRTPYFVPILGRLPILGPAFQWPRRDKVVRHESIILVNAVVLPRTTMLTDRF